MFGLALYAMGSLGLATPPAASTGVTSIGLTMPSIFGVSGSPVTSSGTIAVTLASQGANTILAAPDAVGGVPTFRALVPADIPSLDAGKISTGVFAQARLGTGTADTSTWLRGDGSWQTIPGGFTDPMTSVGDIIIRNAANATTRLAAGTNGHVLTLVTGVPAWQAVTVTPAGSTTQLQFNNAGALGASSGLSWDDTVKTLSIVGTGGSASTVVVTAPTAAVAGLAITSNATAAYGITVSDAALPVNALGAFTGVDSSAATLAAYVGAKPAATGVASITFGGFFSANSTASVPLGASITTVNTALNAYDVLALYARSSGTPGAAFGTRIGFYLESSTTNDTFAGSLNVYWTTATHASRTSAIKITGVSNAVVTDYVVLVPGSMTLATGMGLVVNRTTGGGNVVDVTSGGSGNAVQITATSGVPFRCDDSASNVGFNWYKSTALTAMFVQSTGTYSSAGTSLAQFVLAGASTTTDVAALTLAKSYNATLNASVHNLMRLANDTTTAAAPGAGFGLAIDWVMRTASSSTRVSVANLAAVFSDSTTGSEDADFVFTLMKAGSLTEAARFIGTGALRIGTASAYVAHQPSSGTTTYTWPTGYPAASTGYFLTSTTSGVLTWATISAMTDPMTTDGDMIVRASGVPARLAVGGAGTFLISNGSAPSWASSVTVASTSPLLTLKNSHATAYSVLSLGDITYASSALMAYGATRVARFESASVTTNSYCVELINDNQSWVGPYSDLLLIEKGGIVPSSNEGVTTFWRLSDNSRTTRDVMRMGVVWGSSASGSYRSDYIIQLVRSASALTEVWRVTGGGEVVSAITTTTTNASVTTQTTTLASTGTAAASLAARHLYQLHDSGGALSDAVALDAKWTTATATSEEASYEVRLATAGSLALAFTIAPAYVNIHDASGQLRIAGTKVMGPRITGWGAPTGTATRSTFDTASVTLSALAERMKALVDDLMAHGLIGI